MTSTGSSLEPREKGISTYRVERRFELPVPIEEAFRLLSDPRRLNSLTPGWFELQLLSTPAPKLGVGDLIDYRFRWRLLRLPWRSVITEWQPPRRLTYEQARGPYRSFRHVHVFTPTSEGTVIVDRIDFSPPLRLLRPLISRELERILDFRASASREMVRSAGT